MAVFIIYGLTYDTLQDPKWKKTNIIYSVALLCSRVSIGYRSSVIDIDAALLESWIMQSWDFDTLPYVAKRKSRSSWCNIGSKDNWNS